MAFLEELSKKAQVVAGVVAEKAKDAATTRLVRGKSHLVLPTIPAS